MMSKISSFAASPQGKKLDMAAAKRLCKFQRPFSRPESPSGCSHFRAKCTPKPTLMLHPNPRRRPPAARPRLPPTGATGAGMTTRSGSECRQGWSPGSRCRCSCMAPTPRVLWNIMVFFWLHFPSNWLMLLPVFLGFVGDCRKSLASNWMI